MQEEAAGPLTQQGMGGHESSQGEACQPNRGCEDSDNMSPPALRAPRRSSRLDSPKEWCFDVTVPHNEGRGGARLGRCPERHEGHQRVSDCTGSDFVETALFPPPPTPQVQEAQGNRINQLS